MLSFLHSVDRAYYINWFWDVKQIWHSSINSTWSWCAIFFNTAGLYVEDFCVHINEDIDLHFLYCNIFICLWYHGNIEFMKWLKSANKNLPDFTEYVCSLKHISYNSLTADNSVLAFTTSLYRASKSTRRPQGLHRSLLSPCISSMGKYTCPCWSWDVLELFQRHSQNYLIHNLSSQSSCLVFPTHPPTVIHCLRQQWLKHVSVYALDKVSSFSAG